jgi:hypothetical protein
MDVPISDVEKKEFEKAVLHSFACNIHESVVDQNRRLLMEFYSMGRRHERHEFQEGSICDIQDEV